MTYLENLRIICNAIWRILSCIELIPVICIFGLLLWIILYIQGLIYFIPKIGEWWSIFGFVFFTIFYIPLIATIVDWVK